MILVLVVHWFMLHRGRNNGCEKDPFYMVLSICSFAFVWVDVEEFQAVEFVVGCLN